MMVRMVCTKAASYRWFCVTFLGVLFESASCLGIHSQSREPAAAEKEAVGISLHVVVNGIPEDESIVEEAENIIGHAVGDEVVAWMRSYGLYENKPGDRKVIAETLLATTAAVIFCAVIFSLLRLYLPQVYENNARPVDQGGVGSAEKPPGSLFGWASAGLFSTFEQAQKIAGLDSALCIRFNAFALKVMAFIGVPFLITFGPLHSRQLPGNVAAVPGWIDYPRLLIWIHAAAVWYVVVITIQFVFWEMEDFLPRRFEWLQELTPPQSTTILVENIPEEYCSNSELKEYFASLFPFLPKNQVVEVAYVNKYTDKLEKLISDLQQAELTNKRTQSTLSWLQLEAEQVGEADDDAGSLVPSESAGDLSARSASVASPRQPEAPMRPSRSLRASGRNAADAVTSSAARVAKRTLESNKHANDYLERLRTKVKEERNHILEAGNLPMRKEVDVVTGVETVHLQDAARAITASTGFVTFTSEILALFVLNMRLHVNADKFTISIPPKVTDVLWSDLKVSETKQWYYDLMGYVCIGGCFLSLRLLSVVAKRIDMFCQDQYCSPWQGIVHTLPLQAFLSYLPTVLMIIFGIFFSLKAKAWAQKTLQTFYFWFMMFLIIIRPALGPHVVSCIMNANPGIVMDMLAENLPHFTTWFTCFLSFRCITHGLNLTRYCNLVYYCCYRTFHSKAEAANLSEPEDQDFYGLGSRSARFAIDLIIGLVFCSLAPLITAIACFNFFISRVFYGYLIVYAETRKHDTGGTFFVSMLWHVQYGLMVYGVIMWGVITRWSGAMGMQGPGILAGLSLFYMAYCLRRFDRKFAWKEVPFEVVVSNAALAAADEEMALYKGLSFYSAQAESYKQPELKEEENDSPTETPRQLQSRKCSRHVGVI